MYIYIYNLIYVSIYLSIYPYPSVSGVPRKVEFPSVVSLADVHTRNAPSAMRAAVVHDSHLV